MKKLLMITVLAAGILFFTNNTEAQVRINVNTGSQPAWAPTGYDDAQYYYIPDMDVYYDVPAHQFVYLNNHRWVHTATLPTTYRRYDLYKVHKVALNERDAYRDHDRDKQQYAGFRGKYDQSPIRDNRYAANRNNWKNNHFVQNERKDNQRKDDRHDNRHYNGR